MKVPRGFESHPLRHRVPYVEKFGLLIAKSPLGRRFLNRESLRDKHLAPIRQDFAHFSLFRLSGGDFATSSGLRIGKEKTPLGESPLQVRMTASREESPVR